MRRPAAAGRGVRVLPGRAREQRETGQNSEERRRTVKNSEKQALGQHQQAPIGTVKHRVAGRNGGFPPFLTGSAVAPGNILGHGRGRRGRNWLPIGSELVRFGSNRFE